MCGRYALSLPAGAVRMHIENELERPVAAWEDEDDYNPSRGYNIAPRTRNPIILRGGASGDADHEPEDQHDTDSGHGKKTDSGKTVLRMENMQWGLIPHWMKRAPDSGSMLKTINAREDTINEGGSMWKSIRGRKRCIVVAEGFYEWLHKGTERIPHFIKRRDGKLMCFAGLWDSVTYEGEKAPLHTYTIVTVDSNKQMTFLHNRMPAILSDPEAIATWLDTSDGTWSGKVSSLLKPFEGELDIYAVPREVGKVGTQSPDYLKPVSERKGNIASFFAKQTKKEEGKATDVKEKKTASLETERKSGSPEDEKAEELAKDVNAKEGMVLSQDEKNASQRARFRGIPSDKASSSKSAKRSSSPAKLPDSGKTEEDNTELPLNPDEGSALANNIETEQNEDAGKGKSKAIVLDDQSSEAGDTKKDPIVLEDFESDTVSIPSSPPPSSSKSKRGRKGSKAAQSTTHPKTPANKRKRRSSSEHEPPRKTTRLTAGSSASKPKATKSNQDAGSSHDKKRDVDHQGNEKLENYFEIEDD